MADIAALAQEFDRWGMAAVIDGFPAQIEVALGAGMPEMPRGPFDKVVAAGMGGSASPMDVVSDAFRDRILVPVEVTRHYCPPAGVGARTLAIVSSFSGNTEEAISSLCELSKLTPNVVVLAGGGALAESAGDRPLVRIPTDREPPGFQPRSAVGYMVTYIARILAGCGLLASPQADLGEVPQFLRGADADIRPAAESAALWMGDRIPVVYTDEAHARGVARPAKIKFNENSKRPAMFGALPEANHNEMIGFASPLAEFGVLYLHDPESHPLVRRRFAAMEELFDREGFDHVAFREWEMPGRTRVQRVFAALAYAERCSYTLALLDGVDPTPVDLVEAFKGILDSPRLRAARR